MQSPARHETPKKMTMTVTKSAKRQKVMEACLRKVKANRNSLVSSMRAGGLTPASFRSEIGKLVNYEWSTMENGAGVAPNSAMHVVDPDYQGLRQEELEEAEYAETIIALEQAFLEDERRQWEEDKTRMAAVQQFASNKVRLNIGSRHYTVMPEITAHAHAPPHTHAHAHAQAPPQHAHAHDHRSCCDLQAVKFSRPRGARC